MSQNTFAKQVGLASSTISDWKTKKMKAEPEISKADIRIIEDIHAMKDAQRKRLMKYMEALKQIEQKGTDICKALIYIDDFYDKMNESKRHEFRTVLLERK